MSTRPVVVEREREEFHGEARERERKDYKAPNEVVRHDSKENSTVNCEHVQHHDVGG